MLADSVCSVTNARIVTLVLTVWKPLQAELNTHRQMSKNSASSRAIPSHKMREQVVRSPFSPIEWCLNQKGMSASAAVTNPEIARQCDEKWRKMVDSAVTISGDLSDLGIHKQIANRPLEIGLEVPVVVTATNWKNFFRQRCDPGAQPEMRLIAEDARDAIMASTPRMLKPGEWHLPFVTEADFDALASYEKARITSAARCARASYRLHDGEPTTWEADEKLFRETLVAHGHWSPMEHQAMSCLDRTQRCRNFYGWTQYRALIDGQNEEQECDEAGFDYYSVGSRERLRDRLCGSDGDFVHP